MVTNNRTPLEMKTSCLCSRVPGHQAQAAPFFKARQHDAGIDGRRAPAGHGQEGLGLHVVLDQEHHRQRKAQRARGVGEHRQRDVHVQPRRLQRRHQRMNFRPQQLHQHHAHDRDGHGHRTDHPDAILLFRDQREHCQRPHKAEQHFIDARKRRMARFVPAMCDGRGIGDQSSPCRQRRELYVRFRPGHAESQIERARARVENQRGKQEVGLVQHIAALHHIQKSHEEQEGDGQSHTYDQGRAACGRLLLFSLDFGRR